MRRIPSQRYESAEVMMTLRSFSSENPPRRPSSPSAAMDVVDPSEITTARLYRVQDGDDLRSIADRAYGHAEFWVFILEANRHEIGSGGDVHPGQILQLPDLKDVVRSQPGRRSADPESK
jgi:nucleoid-associated protein YgaU